MERAASPLKAVAFGVAVLYHRLRLGCYKLCNASLDSKHNKDDGSAFELALGVAIIVNVATMGARTFTAADEYILVEDAAAIEAHEAESNPFLVQANIFFVFLFFLEMILKLLAYGFRQYWRSWWNRFDASLVFLSVLSDLVFGLFVSKVNPSVFRIFRIARLAKLARSIRALRLIRMNPATAEMVETATWRCCTHCRPL